jgi:hypothetical protein
VCKRDEFLIVDSHGTILNPEELNNYNRRKQYSIFTFLNYRVIIFINTFKEDL